MKIISLVFLICFIINSSFAVLKCEKSFFRTKFINGQMNLSVLLLWFPTKAGSESKIRLCSSETGLPLQRHCAYNRLNNTAVWEEMNANIKLVNCSSVQKYCWEEPFYHNYVMKNGILKPFNNTWKMAKIAERADLQEPCLNKNGLPITRRCEFKFQQLAADWELLSPEMRNISCLRDTREEIITYDLNALYNEVKYDEEVDNLKPTIAVKKMTELLKTSQTVRVPADIKITSEILRIVTEDNRNPELVTQVLNVSDIIMASDPHIIYMSDKVNATTNLLNTIDKYLHNMAQVLVPTNHCHNTTDGIFYKTVERTTVFYINPMCSNISGVAIHHRHHDHRHQRYDSHTGNYYRFIYLNQSLEQIYTEPDLRLAAYLPLSLWNKLKDSTVDDQTVLTFVIFPNDVLFVNRTKMEFKPAKRVLEIAIPNYTGELPEDVPFILSYKKRHSNSYQPPNCGYWNYSTWITKGLRTEYKNISNNNNLIICHSRHLSHFAAIFRTSSFPSLSFGETILLSISHDIMLDYISITGCGLSLIGLTCIWLTAICFRSWRNQASIKVLLNMCFVLTLIMLFFLLLNLPQLWKNYIEMQNQVHCMIMGGFLHYNILVLFLWMLILAIMQYQRYVKVMGYVRSSNFIIKYAIAAWGLPLIPVGLVAFLEPHTYTPEPERIANNTAICYPSGRSLYYGVILPMAIIMLTNLSIFIYIFYSLHHYLGQFNHRDDKKRIVAQVRISVLLFFLLGISWIFGLLSYLDNTPVFSYIFCLTSTLQGFVLFIYSIVIEKSTRDLWLILCCAKSYNTGENKN